ncbi:MAG: hypothetical protein C5B60_05735 [Chloroflexi bacterium]|nr:MAG: hypothetical protein C5B60_05735 [Chloroflexota bacterium]
MPGHRTTIIRAIMAVAIVLLILGIGGGLLLAHGVSQSPSPSLTQHSWKLEALTFGGHPEALLPGVSITLTFMGQNRISGDDGCNSYGANYTVSHGHLHLDHFYQTLVACLPAVVMQQEGNYMQTLEQVTTYEIGPTGLLTLRDDSGQVVLQYSPVPPA